MAQEPDERNRRFSSSPPVPAAQFRAEVQLAASNTYRTLLEQQCPHLVHFAHFEENTAPAPVISVPAPAKIALAKSACCPKTSHEVSPNQSEAVSGHQDRRQRLPTAHC
jgi:hypothetical protein